MTIAARPEWLRRLAVLHANYLKETRMNHDPNHVVVQRDDLKALIDVARRVHDEWPASYDQPIHFGDRDWSHDDLGELIDRYDFADASVGAAR